MVMVFSLVQGSLVGHWTLQLLRELIDRARPIRVYHNEPFYHSLYNLYNVGVRSYQSNMHDMDLYHFG